MLQVCIFIFTVLLFFLLTPDILIPKPLKTNKYVIALVHAILFALIFQLTNKLVWNVTEAFTTTQPVISVTPTATRAAVAQAQVATAQAAQAATVAAVAATTARANPTVATITNAQATAAVATQKAAAATAATQKAAVATQKAATATAATQRAATVAPVVTRSAEEIQATKVAKAAADKAVADAKAEALRLKKIADGASALSNAQINLANKANDYSRILSA
jgi:hypothetical protein